MLSDLSCWFSSSCTCKGKLQHFQWEVYVQGRRKKSKIFRREIGDLAGIPSTILFTLTVLSPSFRVYVVLVHCGCVFTWGHVCSHECICEHMEEKHIPIWASVSGSLNLIPGILPSHLTLSDSVSNPEFADVASLSRQLATSSPLLRWELQVSCCTHPAFKWVLGIRILGFLLAWHAL